MKISIITVSYNSEKTIRDTIESVLKQSYDDIEYIVVDGLSTDNTVNIVREYESDFKLKDYNFVVTSEKDEGLYDAINKGIGFASGDVIGILNSDDYYFDNLAVERIANAIKESDVDCVYGNLIYFDPVSFKTTRVWKSRNFEDGLFSKSWTPAHPTFYCKKSCYEEFGFYKTDYKIAADVELMYRYLQKHKISSRYLDEFIVRMRQGGVSSQGVKSTIIITKEMRRAFRENGDRLNLAIYLFFKLLKVKQILAKKGIIQSDLLV